MPPAAVLDVDGTLVDTNYQHALAWYRAFKVQGLVMPLWAIHRHVGMGGDQLVKALAGEGFNEEHGEEVRHARRALYMSMINEVEPLEGAREFMQGLKRSGHTVILASSAEPEELQHYLDLLDARELADDWTTSGDVEQTKPEPDLVSTAVEKAGGGAAVMIGDSTWDCEAAKRAGVPTIAVLTGGFSREELTEAGAAEVVAAIPELLDALDRLFAEQVVPERVAAILVEPLLGEGGYVVPPEGFLPALRDVCDRHGIVLVADEVQSGFGRTGRMFACEHHDLHPDIVTLAKGIGSGMPMGACVARADLMDWQPGAHASTFGGNPVALAAALKTIELLEGGLVANSAEVGAYLQDGLRRLASKHDCIGDVRGLGLMVGVEFVSDRDSREPEPALRDRVEFECYRRGLILLGAGHNTIRWSPPLVLARENVDVALEIFDESITAACR